jgi:hypothetical protein
VDGVDVEAVVEATLLRELWKCSWTARFASAHLALALKTAASRIG